MSSDGDGTRPASARLWRMAHLATPMALRVAATLRIADRIGDGARTAADLARECVVDADALDRVLSHLASKGVLERDGEEYRLTALGEPLRASHPDGIASMLDIEGAVGRAELAFVHLLRSVRTGEAAYPLLYGRGFWDDLAADPGLAASFAARMGNDMATTRAKAIVSGTDWSRFSRVVDVGGGSAALLISLLQAEEGLRGTVVDLPDVAELSRESIAKAGLAHRADAVAGSFFDPLPAGADAYVLSSVLHDWDDADAVRILRRCAEAAGPDGRVIVLERIGGDGEHPGTAMDLRMLAYYGGRERDSAALLALAEAAGLAEVGMASTDADVTIIELCSATRHVDEQITRLVAPEGRRDPYPAYRDLHNRAGLAWASSGMLVVTGYATCRQALRELNLFVQDAASHDKSHPGWREHSSLRGFNDSMLYRNPPDHTRMRGLIAGTFTMRRIHALRPVVEQLTDRLLDRLAGESTVDFMAEFAYRLPVAVIGALLGVPERDQEWFRTASSFVTEALEGITRLEQLTEADSAMDELSAYFLDLIATRRDAPADDLISALVAAHDGDRRLSSDELVGNLVLLLVAGFDTTTHLLGHGLAAAFEHPEYARALRTDPDLAVGFVEETLRMEPPVQATSRWAAKDVTLGNVDVPAGTKVLLLLAAANRDPVRYADPDRFDPHRTDIAPLSFGGGIHLCLGATLARMEGQVALPALLRRFPDIAPAPGARYRDRWLVRGHDHLPVEPGRSA
jgi:cytochrome P450